MTLEDRFRDVACELAVVRQDCGNLQHHAAELNECCETQAARIDEARGVIIAFLTCATAGPGLDPALSERANNWLKEG